MEAPNPLTAAATNIRVMIKDLFNKNELELGYSVLNAGKINVDTQNVQQSAPITKHKRAPNFFTIGNETKHEHPKQIYNTARLQKPRLPKLLSYKT